MVLNLCLPHFNTSAHCNKLCADGYDVTNLVSADPALRRRGFKLEYFLRPPVQVTLKFGFQVELCRVDIELWPWGMDRGQACKKLEISTCSNEPVSKNFSQSYKQGQQKEQKQVKDQSKQNTETQKGLDSKYGQSNCHQWSLQAQQWGEQTPNEPQQKGHVLNHQSNTDSGDLVLDFKLVGRCELREETHVCFTRSNYRHRPPFLSPPPPQPAICRQEELWSRGQFSLGAVTQLRVTLPYGGAASALGLKALTVWGQPARCCPAEEVERVKRVHEANYERIPRPVMFTPPVRQTKPPSQAAKTHSNRPIPEEFLDPITQEVMMLPMLLPCGVSVDNSTLEEHQKREATWGRAPNDPFTGVPFTSTSQPLPNPQLKSRIDLFLLQKGMKGREGMLGRQGEGENPQASRLLASRMEGQSQAFSCSKENSVNCTDFNYNEAGRNSKGIRTIEKTGSGHPPEAGNDTCSSEPLTTDRRTAEENLPPQTKRPRNDSVSDCSSHEQRLSASLDEALLSALQGRPSFTTNLSGQKQVTFDSETQKASLQSQTEGTSSMQRGEKTCSACSCRISVYSRSSLCIYRLTCGHLLCGTCLRRKPQPLNSVTGSTSDHVPCPSCLNPTPRSDIMRVHH